MKRIFTTALVLFMTILCMKAATLTENFDTGMPSSGTTGEVTLPSGTWQFNKVYGKTDNGSMRACMPSGSSMITPAIDKPTSVTFNHRASGSGKVIIVEKSTDGGTTWTEIGKATSSSNSTYGSASVSVQSGEGDTSVFIRFSVASGTVYIDNVSIGYGSASSGGDPGDEPVNPDPQDTIPYNGPHSVEHCIYVAPWAADDSGDGSWEHPFYNLQVAVNKAVAGDTIYVRGGTYYPNYMEDGSKTTVRITKKGDADHWFTIKTFPGEFPVLNFKDQPKKVSVRGMLISYEAGYWNISGLHITHAGDNGIKLEGSHNIIRNCTFSYNDDSGIQLGFGHNFSNSVGGLASSNDGTWCSYNDIIDCDSYLNYDSDNRGSDADGFACKMHNGIGNRFIRCRAWDNADDGWDLYETDYAVKLIECWEWNSGKQENFGWAGETGGSFQGNGNGIKLGGNGSGGSSKGIHECWRCVAFDNNKTGSVKGFDENSHKGGVKLVNCLAFNNGYDFMFEDADATNFSFFNNVCFGNIEIGSNGAINSNNAIPKENKKAWNNDVIIGGFSASDYVSLSQEDAKAPRQADGSMPTRFARLRPGSKLIDAGIDKYDECEMMKDYPFTYEPVYGSARDLGPYEWTPAGTTAVSQMIINGSEDVTLKVSYNYNSAVFTTPKGGHATLRLFSLQGGNLGTIADLNATDGAEYSYPLPAGLQRGVYILHLDINGQSKSQKFIVK